jgi:hypothetical protein
MVRLTLEECTCQALFVVENTQKKAGVDVTRVGLTTSYNLMQLITNDKPRRSITV